MQTNCVHGYHQHQCHPGAWNSASQLVPASKSRYLLSPSPANEFHTQPTSSHCLFRKFHACMMLEPRSHALSLAAKETGNSHFLASILGDGEGAGVIKLKMSQTGSSKTWQVSSTQLFERTDIMSAETSMKNKSNNREFLIWKIHCKTAIMHVLPEYLHIEIKSRWIKELGWFLTH